MITGNIGNEDRKQYSISGTPVIIAFPVEQLNKELHSDILVTGALRDNVPGHLMESVDRGFYSLKGVYEPVKVYQVIRLNPLPEISGVRL